MAVALQRSSQPPKMLRDVRRVARMGDEFALDGLELKDCAYRVLRHPAVADKTFLIAIGDRTVGGLCSRDPFVGPWQVPVADCAVTLIEFDNVSGEAFAIGERTPLASVNAPASGRMAVGEGDHQHRRGRGSGPWSREAFRNWMAAGGFAGGGAALFDTVKQWRWSSWPALVVSIPVGRIRFPCARPGGQEVLAPVSLIVSAFAPVEDVARHAYAAAAYGCGRD